MQTDIKSMTTEELKDLMRSLGEKEFRAKQIYEWMHKKLASDYEEMTNISAALKEKLKKILFRT